MPIKIFELDIMKFMYYGDVGFVTLVVNDTVCASLTMKEAQAMIDNISMALNGHANECNTVLR